MNPNFLYAQAKELVKQLQQKYEHLQKEQQQILEELEKQFIERQHVFYIIKGAHLGEKLLSKRSPPHSVFSVR